MLKKSIELDKYKVRQQDKDKHEKYFNNIKKKSYVY